MNDPDNLLNGVTVRNGQTVVVSYSASLEQQEPNWKITHVAVVDEKDAPPDCIISGESYTPFCRAEGNRCYQMAECYTMKECQHLPDDEGCDGP